MLTSQPSAINKQGQVCHDTFDSLYPKKKSYVLISRIGLIDRLHWLI